MTDSPSVRPTRRTLTNMGVEVPRLDVDLSELEHPLLVRAQAVPTQVEVHGAQRIQALTDRVWLKVKTGTWRGAAGDVHDASDERGRAVLDAFDAWWWLVAAGPRQSDSDQRDFYARLDVEAHAGGRNTCSTDFLLPQPWDIKRLQAEVATLIVTRLPPAVRRAAAASMADGKVYELNAGPMNVAIRVRLLRDGEVYLGIGSLGATDPDLFALLLSSFDGISVDDWQPEPGPHLHMQPLPGEILWSTMLTPDIQKALVDELDAYEAAE